MEKKEKILRPVGRIHGGALLPHLKSTAEAQSVIMPPPISVKIPMSQHIGAPANPCVKAGDKVFVGTKIGEANGFVSAPVHSSVSGTVKAIEEMNVGGRRTQCVVIESDGLSEKDPELKPFPVNSREDLVKAADLCGLVGLAVRAFLQR